MKDSYQQAFETVLADIAQEQVKIAEAGTRKTARLHELRLDDYKERFRFTLRNTVSDIGSESARDALKSAVEALQAAHIITDEVLETASAFHAKRRQAWRTSTA